ncbi:MAG TPA: hypothetical protein EYP32_01255, partial [Aquificaceae bacterium]|nr:hypothetical protein [Aquificaceae bacterium]
MFKTSEDLMEELKKRGIEISRSWFYMILKDLKEDGIVSIKKRGKRYVYAIPEDSFEKVIEFFTDNYRTRNLLTASDIRRELKKKGFEISWFTLYGILKRVPSEYMITRKKFKKTYYYFKPEVIKYLVEKL